MQRKLVFVLMLGIALVAALGAGCQEDGEKPVSSSTDNIAAVVNGVEMKESQFDEIAMGVRRAQNLETDEEWAEFLQSINETPEGYRINTIEYLVRTEVLKQEAEEKDISTSEEYIDEQIETMKAQYPDEESWNEALMRSGYTLNSYREALYLSDLIGKLRDEVVGDTTVSGEEIQQSLNTYVDSLAGKKSSHILVGTEDEELANDIHNRLIAGELNFEDAVQQYSIGEGSRIDGGNVGWDSINVFVPEYQETLDNLSLDEISEPVQSQFGYHIIMCTGIYDPEVNADGNVVMGSVPSEILEVLSLTIESQKRDEQFDVYMNELLEKADITIYDTDGNEVEDPFSPIKELPNTEETPAEATDQEESVEPAN